MQRSPRILSVMFTVAVLAGLDSRSTLAADDYAFDPIHSSIAFKARHLGISWIHGRFNEASGTFSIDESDPAKSSFTLTIQVASVDTANAKRDEHLLQDDYFDAKKFPTITFVSTAVKPVDGGYAVTGDFTMHGVTKPITFVLKGGFGGEFKGVKRVAFSTELTVKRSDYNFDTRGIGTIGDEIPITIDCEGTRM